MLTSNYAISSVLDLLSTRTCMQHNPRITAVAKLSSSHKAIDTLSFHQLYLFRSVTTIIKTLLLCNAFCNCLILNAIDIVSLQEIQVVQ